ncbi:MAG: 2'-5' RNA ligase family protein [SAR86 cluster bacterium]|nr:2'-5' RNA ligase family protein [SAR86 cluster bacterium]
MSLLITLTPDLVLNKSLSHYVNLLKKETSKAANLFWYKSSDYLVTLNFVAHIEPEQSQELITILNDKLPGIGKISLNINHINYFPNEKGRTLVAYLDSSTKLKSLHHTVSQSLGIVGFDNDLRNYRPHISLVGFKKDEDKLNELPEYEYSNKIIYESIDVFKVSFEGKQRIIERIERINLQN